MKKKKLKFDPSQVARRQLQEADLNFIWSSWLKSYRSSDFSTSISNDVYFTFHQALINHILLNPTNSATVLVDPEHEDEILGYIVYCTTRPIIHYVYVKNSYRGRGIGMYLFQGIAKHYEQIQGKKKFKIETTHKPKNWAKAKKDLSLVYNPYITGDYATYEKVENG